MPPNAPHVTPDATRCWHAATCACNSVMTHIRALIFILSVRACYACYVRTLGCVHGRRRRRPTGDDPSAKRRVVHKTGWPAWARTEPILMPGLAPISIPSLPPSPPAGWHSTPGFRYNQIGRPHCHAADMAACPAAVCYAALRCLSAALLAHACQQSKHCWHRAVLWVLTQLYWHLHERVMHRCVIIHEQRRGHAGVRASAGRVRAADGGRGGLHVAGARNLLGQNHGQAPAAALGHGVS